MPSLDVSAISFCELIGNLSEGILMCSYNAEDIRELWLNGTLDQRAAEAAKELDFGRFKATMGPLYRKDGRYSAVITALVRMHQGWPINPSDHDLAPMTNKMKRFLEANCSS